MDLEKIIDGLIERGADRKEVQRTLDIIASRAKTAGNGPEGRKLVQRIARVLTNMHHPTSGANDKDAPIHDKLQKHFDALDGGA